MSVQNKKSFPCEKHGNKGLFNQDNSMRAQTQEKFHMAEAQKHDFVCFTNILLKPSLSSMYGEMSFAKS